MCIRDSFLPDAGAVTTGSEPTATSSTLLDTKTEQIVLSKTMVNLRLAANSDQGTSYAQFSTGGLSGNRTITVPDLSLTLVGTDSTQVLTNKSIGGLILQDSTDVTKKINFSLANQNALTNTGYQFPATAVLNNNSGAITTTIVTELATQDLKSKSLFTPIIKSDVNPNGSVIINVDNITSSRVIRFPDADATLLSTENVTVDDVNFGAGIGAATVSYTHLTLPTIYSV